MNCANVGKRRRNLIDDEFFPEARKDANRPQTNVIFSELTVQKNRGVKKFVKKQSLESRRSEPVITIKVEPSCDLDTGRIRDETTAEEAMILEDTISLNEERTRFYDDCLEEIRRYEAKIEQYSKKIASIKAKLYCQ